MASWQIYPSPLYYGRLRGGGGGAVHTGVDRAQTPSGRMGACMGGGSGRMHMELKGNEIVGAAGICHLCLICDDAELLLNSIISRNTYIPSSFLPPSIPPPFAATHAHCTH